MTSLSLSIQLSQCNPTGTEPGNGGQFKREIVVEKVRLFLKLSRNNWHGAFLPNIKSESAENKNNKIFHRSSTLRKYQPSQKC